MTNTTPSSPMPKRLGRQVPLLIALSTMLAAPAVGQDDLGRHTLVHDGIERHYYVTVPPEVADGDERVPMVIVLHGGGGNGINAMEMTGFADKAIEEGFIAVFPEGTGQTVLLTWNAGHCCGYAMHSNVDDVGFVADLIDALVADYPVDPDRVYVTGMSNGAMMTHRLGIELSDRIAAIAPVVGGLFGDEEVPPSPVSAIVINGVLDRSLPVEGGMTEGVFPGAWDGTPLMPAAYQGEFWAAADGCDPAPEATEEPAFTLTHYACPDGLAVDYYLVNDNGHAWPGGVQGTRFGDVPTTAINATDVIWDFFRQHSLAGEPQPSRETP
jgi:polyhydroxybutyrate depolymerase